VLYWGFGCSFEGEIVVEEEGMPYVHYTFNLYDFFPWSHDVPSVQKCKPTQTDCFTVLDVGESKRY